MGFIILILLNFTVTTGIIWIIYYKAFLFRIESKKEINLLIQERDSCISKYLSGQKLLNNEQDYNEHLHTEIYEISEENDLLNKRILNLNEKLKKFERKRNPKTGKFIKSNNE